jgi:hypothetical protein
MVVRISKGYVRSDLDSRAVLHVGTKGDIEIIKDKKVIEKIPNIDKVTKALAEIKSPEMFLAVKGQVGSTPRFSQFTRKNGSQGSVTQLHLADVEDGKEKRVVIWDNESEDILSLKPRSVIRLVNVRAKLVQQGELELHGDTGTYIELISTDFERKQISVSMPETYRLLSIGPEKKGANEVTSTSALIVDATGNFYTLIARGSAYEKLLTISKDSLITCTPDRVFDSRLFCENEKTINLLTKDDDSFLDSESLFVKIEQISKKEIPTFVVVIALSRTSLMDIVTKDGSTVKKAELLVGDETGEINLIAWRDLTKMIDDVSPGEKMRIIGAVPQESGFSELGLLIKSYSSIEKLQAK